MLRIEALYEMVLDLEQTRRDQPLPPIGNEEIQQVLESGMMEMEDVEERNQKAGEWSKVYEGLVEGMWAALMVQEPLEVRWVQGC